MQIVNFVNFDQVLEKHENEIAEKSCLVAEVRVLKLLKDLGDERLEVLIVLQYLRSF